MVTIREDVTLEVVLRYLRRFDELPNHTDKLFVVDKDESLKGVLHLKTLLVSDPDQLVGVDGNRCGHISRHRRYRRGGTGIRTLRSGLGTGIDTATG